VNIRQIEIFRAVMINGTATRAGEALLISQPAVSKAIQDLEHDAGFKLFHRMKGRLVPTAEARLFFREVERTFLGVAHLRTAASRIRDFGSGELRVATISAFSTAILPEVLYNFQKSRPGVAITFESHAAPAVCDLVQSGQFQVGIASTATDVSGVDARPFTSHRAVIALPAGHPLAKLDIIEPKHLDGEPFIALAPEDTTRREMEQHFSAAGVVPKVVIETPYTNTICALVRARLGIGLVAPMSAELFEGKGLVLRPFEPAIYFRTLLLLPRNCIPTGNLQAFLDELMKFSTRD